MKLSLGKSSALRLRIPPPTREFKSYYQKAEKIFFIFSKHVTASLCGLPRFFLRSEKGICIGEKLTVF